MSNFNRSGYSLHPPKTRKTILLFLLLALTVVAFRAPTYVPFTWKEDELDYLTGVREILSGEPLYTTYGDLKPPMIFWLYSLTCYVAGDIDIFYVKTLGVILSAATAIGIYYLGSMAGGAALGFISAFLFSGYSICSRGEEMLATNSEMMMNAFVVPAYVFFLAFITNKKSYAGLLCGTLLLSAGFFTNQKAGINILVFFLLILLGQRGDEREGIVKKLKELFLLAFTFTAPVLFFVCYYYFIGYLDQIAYWLYEVPQAYIGSVSFEEKVERLLPRSELFFSGYITLVIPFFYGLFFLFKEKKICRPVWAAIILYLLFSYYAVFTGGKMMERYFIQILPPFLIICSHGLIELYQKVGKWEKGRFFIATLFFLIIMMPPYKFFVRHMETGKPRQEEIANSPGLQKMIHFVRENSKEEDTLFVFPGDRYYYYFLKKRIGSRFNEIRTHLWQPDMHPKDNEVFRKGWKYLFEDLDQRKPKLIIDVSGNFGKLRDDPVHITAMKTKLKNYIENHYLRVGRFGEDTLFVRKEKET